ncbi:Na+/proline symporter [Archaeoglobus sulfaticallidus PM70-1]|uniref:Na+/proline symporter n=1 Tax=Archaeoglobus sulfaticallidus PM70-1 TaxID=387631 RepID=N0BLT3_9EURY|nr:sodium:solute symporter family protein [Archaeoglobus sulfaticallidus]AGK61205.1 Na+/proline symporter [Archaeoglobus sulfaticallidus PM70-1]
MIFLIAFIAYAIIGTAIAIIARKGIRSQEDYYLGGRRIGGIVSALTYSATTYSAFMMVGLVGLTYASGVGSLGFELFYLVGTLFLLSYYAPKIWKLGKERAYITPGDMMVDRYGKLVPKIMAVIVSIALIPYISVQLIGVSLIIEKNSTISFTHAILASAFLIAFWAFLGGLRGVAWTDAIQGVFMLIMAVSAVMWAFSMLNGTFFGEISRIGDLLIVPNKIWTPERFIALTVPWFFFALTNPQVFQRIYVPRDERALKKMVILFGTFGLIYTILVTFLGLELRVMTEIGSFPLLKDRDAVTPTFLGIMPPSLAVLISLSIFAAAITTANSIVLTLASMISRDLLGSNRINTGQILIVVLTIAITLFSIQRPGYIVNLAVLSSTLLLCQLPLILGVFHWKSGGEKAAISTLIVGFATAILLFYMKLNPLGIPASVWTLVISFATFFAVASVEKS